MCSPSEISACGSRTHVGRHDGSNRRSAGLNDLLVWIFSGNCVLVLRLARPVANGRVELRRFANWFYYAGTLTPLSSNHFSFTLYSGDSPHLPSPVRSNIRPLLSVA